MHICCVATWLCVSLNLAFFSLLLIYTKLVPSEDEEDSTALLEAQGGSEITSGDFFALNTKNGSGSSGGALANTLLVSPPPAIPSTVAELPPLPASVTWSNGSLEVSERLGLIDVTHRLQL